VIAEPTPRHAAVLGGLLREVGTAGNLTTDAHLAALAIEHGADVVSYDRDFARFPGVRHRLPGG
jgi:predicted nucleic acid-binding protein